MNDVFLAFGSWYLEEASWPSIPRTLSRSAAGAVGTLERPFAPGADGTLHPDVGCSGALPDAPVRYLSYLEASRLGVPLRCPSCVVDHSVVDLESSLGLLGMVARSELLLARPARPPVVVGELLRLGAAVGEICDWLVGLDPVAAAAGLAMLERLEAFRVSLPTPPLPSGPVECVWMSRSWRDLHPATPGSAEVWYTFLASLGPRLPHLDDPHPGRVLLLPAGLVSRLGEDAQLRRIADGSTLSRERLELLAVLAGDDPDAVLDRDRLPRLLALVGEV